MPPLSGENLASNGLYSYALMKNSSQPYFVSTDKRCNHFSGKLGLTRTEYPLMSRTFPNVSIMLCLDNKGPLAT